MTAPRRTLAKSVQHLKNGGIESERTFQAGRRWNPTSVGSQSEAKVLC